MSSNIASEEETWPLADMPSNVPQNSIRSDNASLATREPNDTRFGEINSREIEKHLATPEQELDESLHSDWCPRPLLDPGASQFSRSQNDVSTLTNRDQDRDQNSKVW